MVLKKFWMQCCLRASGDSDMYGRGYGGFKYYGGFLTL